MLARQKNYAEAQRIKKIADQLENKERKACENVGGGAFSRKDGQFRTQQQSELQALLKRIDARRKRDYAAADSLRNDLQNLGIFVDDKERTWSMQRPPRS